MSLKLVVRHLWDMLLWGSERKFFDCNYVRFYITSMKDVQRSQYPNKGSTTKNGERGRSGVPTPLLQRD
ncbi:hypothetical protein POVCU1_031900 [Plasmodium ovale curtisi]|uniref:Uncharacterized protein n=1 Tax=Plasmodium ovale curtisi TaxID=864141 RepID=A0A1A8WTR7_PLAOA|nr:hypothetical protein POVCU1_031900 [Plasmodium ovale curtisi]